MNVTASMDVMDNMSFYCWFEYRGKIKEPFRDDIESAVNEKNWAAVQSDTLRKVLSDYMDQDNENSNVNCMLETIESTDRIVQYNKETGILYIKYEYNASHDAWQTYDFTSGFLPYITEEILTYHTGNEAFEESEGIPYRDDTEDFKRNMDYTDAKYHY